MIAHRFVEGYMCYSNRDADSPRRRIGRQSETDCADAVA